MASPAGSDDVIEDDNESLFIQNEKISSGDVEPRSHASNDNLYQLNDENHFLRDYKEPLKKKQSYDDDDTADEDDGSILRSTYHENTDDDDDTNEDRENHDIMVDHLDNGDRDSVFDAEKEENPCNDFFQINPEEMLQILDNQDVVDTDNGENKLYKVDHIVEIKDNRDSVVLEYSGDNDQKNFEIDNCNLDTTVSIDVIGIISESVPIVCETPDNTENGDHNDIICHDGLIQNDDINESVSGNEYDADRSGCPSSINSEEAAPSGIDTNNSGVTAVTKNPYDVLVGNLMSSTLSSCISQSIPKILQEDLSDNGNQVTDYKQQQDKDEILEADTSNKMQMLEEEVEIGEGEGDIIDIDLGVKDKKEEETLEVLQFEEIIEEMIEKIEENESKSVARSDVDQNDVKDVIYWGSSSSDNDGDECNDDGDGNMGNDSDEYDKGFKDSPLGNSDVLPSPQYKVLLGKTSINNGNDQKDIKNDAFDNYGISDGKLSDDGSSDYINLSATCKNNGTSGTYDIVSTASPIDSQKNEDEILESATDPVHVVSAVKSTRGGREKAPKATPSMKRGRGSDVKIPHTNATSPSFVNSVINCTHTTTPLKGYDSQARLQEAIRRQSHEETVICHTFEGPDSVVAFTTINQISGSDRTLGKLWSANKRPETLVWSFIMTKDLYEKRKFDIDISLSDDVSVFACNHVEKESKGSVIMKRVTDKSYACFMDVLPSPQYEVVLIVPSDGLFAKKARKHLCEFKSDFLIITCARGSFKVQPTPSMLPLITDSKKHPLDLSASHTNTLTKKDPDFESMGLYDDIDHMDYHDDESPSLNEPLSVTQKFELKLKALEHARPTSTVAPIATAPIGLHPHPPISTYRLSGIPKKTMPTVKYLTADKINIAPSLNVTAIPHHRPPPPPPRQPHPTSVPQGLEYGNTFGHHSGIVMVPPQRSGESGMIRPGSLTSNNQIPGMLYDGQDRNGSGYQGYGPNWQYSPQEQGQFYQQGQAPYPQNQLPPEVLALLNYYRPLHAPSHNSEPLPQAGINSHDRLSRSVSKRDKAKRARSSSTDSRSDLDREKRKKSKRGKSKSRRRESSDSSESNSSDSSDSSEYERHSSRKSSKKSRAREKSRPKSRRRSRSQSKGSKETRKEKERRRKKEKEKKKNSEDKRGREKVRDRERKDFDDKGSGGGRSRSRMRIRSPSGDRVTASRSSHTSSTHYASNGDHNYDRGKSVQNSSRYRDSNDTHDNDRGRSLHNSSNNSFRTGNHSQARGKSINNSNNSSYIRNRSPSRYSDRNTQNLPPTSNNNYPRNRSRSRYAERTIPTSPPDNHSHVRGKSINTSRNSSSNTSSNQDVLVPFIPPPGLNGIGRGQHRTMPAWKNDNSLSGDVTTTSVANNTAANAFIASIGAVVVEKREGENVTNMNGRGTVRAFGVEEGEVSGLNVLVQAPTIINDSNSDVSPTIRDISSESAIQKRIREKSLKKQALSQGKR